jgi:polar amino acid transport system substrate-binding protein
MTTGPSIDLWQRIADQMHLRFRFQVTTLSGLTDRVAEGSSDAAVAALTVTSPQRRLVDFTQPFDSTGLGIAVARNAAITWLPIVGNAFSLGFLGAVVVLFAVSLGVGVCPGWSSAGTTSILAPIGVAWAQVFGGRPWR